MSSEVVIGVDVSKQMLDVAIDGSEAVFQYGNETTGFNKLLKLAKKQNAKLVVFEASGGYEREIVRYLSQRKVSVAVVNPGQVRHFAKGIGQKAKNDRIDAKIIAKFGSAVQPKAMTDLDKGRLVLSEKTTCRNQLVNALMALKNQIRLSKHTSQYTTPLITLYERQLKQIDSDIQAEINKSTELKNRAEILKSFPGIGDVLGALFLAELPELGTVNREKIASLVGVAPYARESGTFKGKRFCTGGRGKVRRALYLASISACIWCPYFRVFYERLTSKGKPKKVVRMACMRKMLVLLNTMLAHGLLWTKTDAFASMSSLKGALATP
jgi:transposase